MLYDRLWRRYEQEEDSIRFMNRFLIQRFNTFTFALEGPQSQQRSLVLNCEYFL